MSQQPALRSISWRCFLAAILCGGIANLTGDAAAQRPPPALPTKDASAGDFQYILKSNRPNSDEWLVRADRSLVLLSQPGGAISLNYCDPRMVCKPLCSNTKKALLDICAGEYTQEFRLQVMLHGFLANTRVTEVTLKSQASSGDGHSSIADRAITLKTTNNLHYDTEHGITGRSPLYAEWRAQIKPPHILMLSQQPFPFKSPESIATDPSTPKKPQTSSNQPMVASRQTPAAARSDVVAVTLPGLGSDQNLQHLFEDRELASCLSGAITDGKLIAAAVQKEPGKDVVLKLILDPATIGSNLALFGTQLECVARKSCVPDEKPVPVNVRVLKVVHPAGGKEETLVRTPGAFRVGRNSHPVTCRAEGSTYFLMRRDEFPSLDESVHKEHGLVIRTEREEIPAKSPIAFSNSRPVVVVHAVAPRSKSYNIFMRPLLDSGTEIDATEAVNYIGNAQFTLDAKGGQQKKATAAGDPSGLLVLSEAIELESPQHLTVRVPPSPEGLGLTNFKVHSKPDYISYDVTLPAAAFKPIVVALEPKRALYGKEAPATEYPGRNCRMTLQVDKRELVLDYGRVTDGGPVVLKLREKQDGGVPTILEAQRSLRASGNSARVRISEAAAAQNDPCKGELKARNLEVDDKIGRLSGSVQLPLPKPMVLGLIAPKASGDIGVGSSVVRFLLDSIAHEILRSMDEAYDREKDKWSTADVLAIDGNEDQEEDLGKSLQHRLLAGGMKEKTKPDNVRFVKDGPTALAAAWNVGSAAQPDDFVAAINAYRGLHGLDAASEPRVVVVGLVSGNGTERRCNKWVEELGKLGRMVSVHLLIADDQSVGASRSLAITRCGRDDARVKVYTFPLAVAAQFDTAAAMQLLKLPLRIGEAMRD